MDPIEDPATTMEESQAANPQMPSPVTRKAVPHTLDESDIENYPEELKAKLEAALHKLEKHNALKIGVALFDTHLQDKHIRAIPSIISNCKLVALTLINADSLVAETKDPKEAAREWLETHGSGYPVLTDFFSKDTLKTPKQPLSFKVDIYLGQSGYEEMLSSNTVDAVYVLCPTESQPAFVLQALRASKHVLVHDHQSTTLRDFQDQMEAAHKAKRFIQFSTMFAHQYRVQTFLDSVAHKLGAENMKHMHLFLRVHPRDWAHMGVVLPTSANFQLTQSHDSCIRRLARYGVLTALLLLQQKAQYKPTSVQIHECELNAHGVVVQAAGEVWFTENSKMSFDVGYVGSAGSNKRSPTRQVLEVHTDDRYATINDICIHPTMAAGLANYRIYGKKMESHSKFFEEQHHRVETPTSPQQHQLGTESPTHTVEVVVSGGDSLDVVSGPSMQVITWRRFAEICRAVEEEEQPQQQVDNGPTINETSTKTTTTANKEENQRLREQGEVFQRTAIQLKSILNCLEASQKLGNIRISLPENLQTTTKST